MLHVNVKACAAGEVRSARDRHSCFQCPRGKFSLEPGEMSEDGICHQCPNGAFCPGYLKSPPKQNQSSLTAVIALQHYWQWPTNATHLIHCDNAPPDGTTQTCLGAFRLGSPHPLYNPTWNSPRPTCDVTGDSWQEVCHSAELRWAQTFSVPPPMLPVTNASSSPASRRLGAESGNATSPSDITSGQTGCWDNHTEARAVADALGIEGIDSCEDVVDW